ncbi:MAG: alpha-glucan family phosphorylase, partial [Alphaproteobacteria bacterium]|nr:alpha-glucan family phosphorylase [Alphaproteobacteria bacterium]
RATLLFNDLDNFRRIVGDKDQLVVFLFAGKAHPADEPGQELIRTLVHMSSQEEFQGHLLFLEGYDLHIARRLVSGVDVWLNNPVHPLEASGTSGMKAGMNGVINLSILDGWWDEGYDGQNGWAIKPASPQLDQHRRDREESRTLYELLQDNVVPLYYKRAEGGYSAEWIRIAKRSMASLLPRYDASRMLGEYVSKFYLPAVRQGHRYTANGHEAAKTIAAWKARVRAAWPGLTIRRLDQFKRRIPFGETLPIEVAIKLNGLTNADVCVELLPSRSLREAAPIEHSHELVAAGGMEGGEERFRIDLKPGLAGRLEYRVRVFPRHELLTHPFEMCLSTWL